MEEHGVCLGHIPLRTAMLFREGSYCVPFSVLSQEMLTTPNRQLGFLKEAFPNRAFLI